MNCPNCKLQHVSKKEMIYERGTSFSGNLSPLAMRAAPPRSTAPEAPKTLGSILSETVVVFILGGIGGVLFAACQTNVANYIPIAPIVGGVISAGFFFLRNTLGAEERKQAFEQALENDRTAYRNWQKQWICLDCGHEFIPDERANPST